jgi:colicin import membrane protein
MTDEPQPPGPVTADVPAEPGVRRPARHRAGPPHLSGDLPTMFDSGPAFGTVMRGYDRLQVDNYVAWAENELRAAQRLTTELVTRLAASEGEAQRARELVAGAARDRDLVVLADRVTELLRLAAQEAEASAQSAVDDAAEAEDVIANAREEAEVIIRRARQLEARAAARLQAAERRLADARTAEERTRSRVQAMLQDASDEQDRLQEDATARLAQTQQEVQELQLRRHRAAELLRQLSGRVDAALAALTEQPAAGYAFSANRAASPPGAAVPDRSGTNHSGTNHSGDHRSGDHRSGDDQPDDDRTLPALQPVPRALSA